MLYDTFGRARGEYYYYCCCCSYYYYYYCY